MSKSWPELERMSIPERTAYVRGRAMAALLLGAPAGAYIEGDLVVYDDQAYTFEEWERLTPRPIGRPRKYFTEDERRKAHRDRNRRARLGAYREVQVYGSLHSLKCRGTRWPQCRCRKILLVREAA